MKSIAFAIVTATALAWGVSVQAAPNSTAGSLKGAERQSFTQLVQHRPINIGTIATAVACATGAAGISTATGCAGVGMASL